MSFLKVAIAILQETGREMAATELVRIVIERGLVESSGKAPGATLAAQLYAQAHDHPQGPLKKIAEPGALRARVVAQFGMSHPGTPDERAIPTRPRTSGRRAG